MTFEIIPLPNFEKEIKKLAKKYPSLKKDITLLVESLKHQPHQGVSIGKSCYKVRMPIASKNLGKSGGARIITVVRILAQKVYLASIYDKSDRENITDKELKEIIKQIH